MTGPEGWRHQAACAKRGVNPDLFHPEAGERTKVAKARRICARCPVQAPCLEEALATPWLAGVWASTTSKDREHIRAERRRDAA